MSSPSYFIPTLHFLGGMRGALARRCALSLLAMSIKGSSSELSLSSSESVKVGNYTINRLHVFLNFLVVSSPHRPALITQA